MRIAIAGGSGFLGRALSDRLLDAGHEVSILTRGPTLTARSASPTPSGAARSPARVSWTPDGNIGPWISAIDGVDALVNLAGESIGNGRWTRARKAALLESRVLATRSLVAAISASKHPPGTMISASAQGYYGEHGDDEVTEETAAGPDFLAQLCKRWEGEARGAESRTRLVILRTGLVLSSNEGALPRMLTPFRMFAGGPLGPGRQFVSWIHWRDWVGIAAWALENSRVAGPLNVSAPRAIRNREFSRAIGRALRRPSWLPAPAFALRIVLGRTMADSLLLTSIRMVPGRVLELGYRFQFPDLDDTLQELLGRRQQATGAKPIA